MGYFAPARRVFWLVFGLLTPLWSAWEIFEHRGLAAKDATAPETMLVAPSESRLVAAPGARSDLGTFRISGQVVDPHGDPISDATVWLEDMGAEDGGRAAVWLGTDSVGRFNAPPAAVGLYTVTAAARGFVARAVAVELDADATELRLALVLAPSPRVLVVDPEGRPVSGAVVVACAEPSEVTLHSASDGTVAFGPGAIGCYATAHHTRFSHSSPVRLEGEHRATLHLERGGSIEGVVSNATGRALFDAEISVTAFDPSEGELPLGGSLPELGAPLGREFRLSGLAPGTYTLAVRRRIRIEDFQGTEELTAASFEVVAGRVVRGVHIVADSSEQPRIDPT